MKLGRIFPLLFFALALGGDFPFGLPRGILPAESSSSSYWKPYPLSSPPKKNSEFPREKTVLYVVDAPGIEWFTLGALYAFETYGIVIDTVVGHSRGGLVLALWKAGFSPDDIQRFLRMEENEDDSDFSFLPLADEGFSGVEQTWAFFSDSLRMEIKQKKRPDKKALREKKWKLRMEEILSRENFPKEFYTVDCSGEKLAGEEALLKTMPFTGNLFGRGCALPLPEAEAKGIHWILTSLPVRFENEASKKSFSSEEKIWAMQVSRELSYYEGAMLVLRPHHAEEKIDDWIQSGFNAVEKRLSVFSSVVELAPYETKNNTSLPWFRPELSLDSVRPELQEHLRSFWHADTGIFPAEKFLDEISAEPLYDSVSISMREGAFCVSASSSPLIRVRAGGFGSNIFGPIAALDARFRYVNQFEYELGALFFYGIGAKGVSPELRLFKLLSGQLDLGFRYEYAKLSPLKSYFSFDTYRTKILEESKRDLVLSVNYFPDSLFRVSFFARLGAREYKMSKRVSDERVELRSLFPEFNINWGRLKNKWFDPDGHLVSAFIGLESDGASFGVGESVPIYWKMGASFSMTRSLTDYLIFGLGGALGANIYREDGDEFPPSFGFEPIDWTLRQGIEATPWSSEWFFNELRSHEYALLRGHLGLSKGPFGAFFFFAYIRDFENANPYLGKNRLVLEPALRFAFRSLSVYTGMHKTLDIDESSDFGELKTYRYFIRVGNYAF